MKTRVLQLVDDLSVGLADAAQSEYFYDQILYELHHQVLFTECSLVAATAETASYTLPTTAVRQLMFFWDTQQLDELTIEEAEAIFGLTWRDLIGPPEAYVLERETDRTFRLVPTPDTSSKDFSFMFGLPLGVDFPEYAISVVHTNYSADVHVLFDFPLAFAVLAREFLRESDHQDVDFAEACQMVSAYLLGMITNTQA